MDKAQGNKWLRRTALGLLLAVALALRLTGVATDYPWYWYPDRDVPVHARECINTSHPRLDPGEYIYPTAYIYLNAAVYAVVGVTAVATGAVQGMHGLAELYFGKFGFLMAVTRIVGTLLSLVMIWLVSRVVRKVAGELAGVLAAVALTFAWLDVVCCHYPTTDVPSALMLLATAVFALRLYERKAGKWDYVVGGLLAGAAAATKYPAGAGMVSLVVAHWLARKREREDGDEAGARERPGLLAGWAIIAGATVLGFLILCPWAVLSWPAFFTDMLYQSVYNASGPEAPWRLGRFLFSMTPPGGMGLPLTLAALVGFGWMVVKKRREAVILLAGAVLVWLAYAGTRRFFDRWYETLIPFMAMGAGIGVAYVARTLLGRWRVAALAAACVVMAAMVAKPAAFEVWYDQILTAPGTRRAATAYVADKIPEGATVVLTQYAWAGPDVPSGKYKVEWSIPGSPERTYTGLKLKAMLDGGFGQRLKRLSPSAYGKLEARERDFLASGEDLEALVPKLPENAEWAVVNTEGIARVLESSSQGLTPLPGKGSASFQALLHEGYGQMLADLHDREITEESFDPEPRARHPWGTWPYGSPRIVIYHLRPATAAGTADGPPKYR